MTENLYGQIQNLPLSPDSLFSAQILGYLSGDRAAFNQWFVDKRELPHIKHAMDIPTAQSIIDGLSLSLPDKVDKDELGVRVLAAKAMIMSWDSL